MICDYPDNASLDACPTCQHALSNHDDTHRCSVCAIGEQARAVGATPAFTTVYTDAGWSPVPLPDNGQPAVEDGATPEKSEP